MTITEVSKKFNLSKDTLRYYERVGLIPSINRNKNGIRAYTEEDCKWIEFIKCMRSSGLPIEGLINYVALFQQGDETRKHRKEILIEQHEILVEKVKDLNQIINRLEKKIQSYDQIIVPKEQALKVRN